MSDDELIPLCEPCLAGNAQRYLRECVRTNFVSSVGPFVDRFERDFAARVGSRHAVACASGTAALHVALRVVGVGAGDEVFVPSLTFIASASPIVYLRAVPVFVDAEERTWNMDPQLLIDELEQRAKCGAAQPKAVVAVHIQGHPAEMDQLVDACRRYDVAIVEDAAESLGARYTKGPLAGREVGTIGRVGCFSFNGNKIITTGGGGMIVTDDEQLARRARHLTTQAKVAGVEYLHDEIGYNYRLTNLAAAVGVAQLEQLDGFLEKKRRIAATYDAALEPLPGIATAPRAAWADPTFWLYSIRVDAQRFGSDRHALHRSMAQEGIVTRPIWKPLDTQPAFPEPRRLGDGAVARRLHDEGLTLPSSVTLTPGQQQRVIAAIVGQCRAARDDRRDARDRKAA